MDWILAIVIILTSPFWLGLLAIICSLVFALIIILIGVVLVIIGAILDILVGFGNGVLRVLRIKK